METLNGLEIHRFDDAAAWESWLAASHDRSSGVWLVIARKSASRASITIGDAGDIALCYGWIDSHRKGLDAASYLQKYSPRRPTSSWSRVNVERVERLIAGGRMRPPGLAEVKAAKADGRWDAAYESQSNATVPKDLASALERSEVARRRFESLGKTARYALILRLLKLRNPADRETQLEKVMAELDMDVSTG
jgi:uncharacterized protein YdeI (YjbR/CyaY-like superfamily)